MRIRIKAYVTVILAIGMLLTSFANAQPAGISAKSHQGDNFSESVDQCNTTQQCQAIYGNKASDCRDSKSDRSLCMCGSKRCDSNGGPRHPSKRVYNEKFNSLRTNSNWLGTAAKYKGLSKIVQSCGPDGSKCLEVVHKPTSVGSERLVRRDSFKSGSAYTLQYDVRFQKRFEWVKGGKLLGLGPKNPITGGKKPTKDGWSARISFEDYGKASLYVYDQSRLNSGQTYGRGVETKKPVFKSGKWHAVSLYVKLNTVGKSNGSVEMHLDGKKILSMSQLKLRGQSKNSAISKLLFETFYGGNNKSFAPKKVNKIKFDNIAVETGRVIRRKPIFR